MISLAVILPISHFINQSFHQIVILFIGHYIDKSPHVIVYQVTSHLTNQSFDQLVITPTSHYTNQSFHQMDFINWLFYHLDFLTTCYWLFHQIEVDETVVFKMLIGKKDRASFFWKNDDSIHCFFFWFKRVLDQGPEHRESKMTVLWLPIIIILII